MARQLLLLAFTATLPVLAQSAPQQPGKQLPPLPKAPAQQAAAASKPAAGLAAPWDVKQMLADLNARTQKLKPLLDQMHPQQWLDNGAPPTYVNQYYDTKARVDDTVRSAMALAQNTESLSLALDTYFRMEALENVARSLEQCIRRYGERRVADQLAALIAQDFNNRQRFRNYLGDLSIEREQQFKVADEEAQRCRGMISKEPPSRSQGYRRK